MERAKQLRRDQTDAERKLWGRLRAAQLGVKFRRQHPVAGYYADFCCVEHQLIVELDGGQHGEQQAYDARRTRALETTGFRVLRFWNDDALLRTDDVLEAIVHALGEKPPPHPPTGTSFGRNPPPGFAGGEGATHVPSPIPLFRIGVLTAPKCRKALRFEHSIAAMQKVIKQNQSYAIWHRKCFGCREQAPQGSRFAGIPPVPPTSHRVSRMKKITPLLLLALAAAASLPTYATPISATIDLDTIFTGASPSGSSPWLNATFTSDTTSNTGTLTLTSKLAGSDFLQGLENANAAVGWAFFLDIGISSIRCSAGNNCADNVLFDDTFNAGPVGKSWNLAFGWASGDRFEAGDTAVYDITFDSNLTGGSPFGTNTDKKVGGWLSVAHVQGIGSGCSGWIVSGAGNGAQGETEQCSSVQVPEPSVLGMFGLGTLMIGLYAGLRRRLHQGGNSRSF